MSSPGGKERKVTTADQTILQSLRDKKRSFWCNLTGNVIVGCLLLAYIIYAIIYYENKHENSITTVNFSLTNQITFPTVFFQVTEYGQVDNLTVTVFEENCKIENENNASKIGYYLMHNPTSEQIEQHSSKWLILNTTLSYYNYSGYGYNFTYNSSLYSYDANYNYTYNRRLLENNESNYSYADYFTSYTASSYYSSASSNIFILFPPENFQLHTNTEKRCGDVVKIFIGCSVPKEAFNESVASDAFKLSLNVRSFPDSFGLQYGYDSRDAVLESYENKNHVYYSGRLAYGEIKSEQVRETIYKDRVFDDSQTFYQSLATIDYTNFAYNLTTIGDTRISFNTYLYVYANEFLSEYKTLQKLKWTDVLCNIGGMNSTIGEPITFLIVIWLYGISLFGLQFDAKAPLDPLPEDFLKRLDVYIANKVILGELRAGEAWKNPPPPE